MPTDTIRIFHNPHCTTSVNAVRIADELGVEYETVLYMKTPPDAETLRFIATHLDGPVAEMVRKDSRFARLGLDAADYTTVDSVVELLAREKALLQRPIVVRGDRAVVGRPKERVRELLSGAAG